MTALYKKESYAMSLLFTSYKRHQAGFAWL